MAPEPQPATASPVPDVDLQRLLADLLAEGNANGGDLTPDSFWRFAAAVAQGRGITAQLHAEGIYALGRVPSSPKTTHKARQVRAYHIAALLHLLTGMARLPGSDQPDPAKRDGASLLPGNFHAGPLISDLLSILENYPGAKTGEGQILPTGNGGQAHLRGYARRMIVGALHFRAKRQGTSMAKVRNALSPPLAKKTWEHWQGEVGGPLGEVVTSAKREGAEADAGSAFNVTDEKLSAYFSLAAGGPGAQGEE